MYKSELCVVVALSLHWFKSLETCLNDKFKYLNAKTLANMIIHGSGCVVKLVFAKVVPKKEGSQFIKAHFLSIWPRIRVYMLGQ